MANGIQKYIANKTCCIATNVKKTDDKIKYGSEDMICCINKDFMANVFSELLMCNGVATDSTWYSLCYTVQYVDSSPSSFPGNISIPNLTVISYDGTKTLTLNIAQTITATSILDFSSQISVILNNATISDPSLYMEVTSYDELTGEMVICFTYTSDWGNLTDKLTYSLSLTNNLTVTSSFETSLATVNTDTCLSSTQLCSIKNWLDKYCQSC